MHARFANKAMVMMTGLALLVALGLPELTRAHEAHHAQEKADKAPGRVRVKLPDTALVDQDGKSVRLRTEAMAGRLVVINFVYTTCTTVCPVQSALIADLRMRLGDRAGRDVALISVTVDPLRDTPQRLKEFAARFGDGPGWRLLTGSRQAVDEVLKAFDAYTSNYADHPAVVLVGDSRGGDWVRFFGFPGADDVMGRMKDLQAAREHAAHAALVTR